MVTMQGEDSGIAWETTPSRCTTPWASEAGNSTVDPSSSVPVQSAKAGSHPAGKIIFVMDDDLISRQKKTKERVSSQKTNAGRQRQLLGESSENISGRPELVGFSQPNLKTEGEEDEEKPADPLVEKEQRLFSLVSEGFEILNIVVPPKLATVDEEESKGMVDNLSYLEETPIPKPSNEILDNEPLMSSSALTVSSAARGDQINPSSLISPYVMDPPGAPVARQPGRGAPRNVDYMEAFTLIDAQAPGGPAVISQGQVASVEEDMTERQDARNPVQPKDNTPTTKTTIDSCLDIEKSDTVSLEGITSELLDEVFYGSTDDYTTKSLDREDEGVPCRLPSKPSGSTLFGSQEDILTPIFLPEGPLKIIDPILLEEPKAMAFLYTDLYEEAIGSRIKEEDTESLSSEKSFHSRHSDREARGYLEKYVLIDETPAVEIQQADKGKCPEEGPRVLTQDLYHFGDFISKPGKGEVSKSEEEITDFFRSSANSSPCDVDPFPQSLEEDEAKSVTKTKPKTTKSVSITVKQFAEIPVDSLSISSFEFPSEEPDWEITDDHPTENNVNIHRNLDLRKQDVESEMPVAPPRRKAMSPPKTCLDLTPLTPVDVIMQEKEEAGGKETREEEEKETASPVETADEGDGDVEETKEPSSENELTAVETGSSQTESIKDSVETNVKDIKPATEHGENTKTAETSMKQTQPQEADNRSTEPAKAEIHPEKQGDPTLPSEPAKDKGQCVIL